jgi:hypothetical protein
MDSTDKLVVIKKEFDTSIYGNNLVWKEGEIVWLVGEDVILGTVTICKFDKPFATYVTKDLVEDFIMEIL